jgi:hypothetical protein
MMIRTASQMDLKKTLTGTITITTMTHFQTLPRMARMIYLMVSHRGSMLNPGTAKLWRVPLRRVRIFQAKFGI